MNKGFEGLNEQRNMVGTNGFHLGILHGLLREGRKEGRKEAWDGWS
jgi:hypothetical protein